MRAWLIKVGEPLPGDPGMDRPLRGGILAERMATAAHDVTFWSSTLDHVRKVQRAESDLRTQVKERYALQLLHAPPYTRNVSLKRIINHRGIAKKFRMIARQSEKPDVIFAAFPTIELCLEIVDYGREAGVPVILDVRDMWPDLIADLAPRGTRWAARLALYPMFADTRKAFAGATAITGITPELVKWGLGYAGRSATKWDRDFPMGYDDKPPDAAAIATAEKFWDQHGVPADQTFRACFFGALSRQFEIEPVIEAARLLKDQNVQLILCGRGDRLELFRSAARDCPNLLFPGWVGYPEMWVLMRRASVGLAPYLSTPNFTGHLPNKPIEYMSGALPIVSSLQGYLRKLIAEYDCGVTYPNGDARALADALLKLRDNPELRWHQSRNARKLFETQFTAEKVYGELAAYLEEVAREYKAGRLK